MNTSGAVAAIKAFREALSGNVVPPEEVVRRTRICKTCPKRKRDSSLRTAISRMLGNLANKHRVPNEIKGMSCGVCGCSWMLLLPAGKDNLHKDSPTEAKARPDGCWMKNLL